MSTAKTNLRMVADTSLLALHYFDHGHTICMAFMLGNLFFFFFMLHNTILKYEVYSCPIFFLSQGLICFLLSSVNEACVRMS